MLWVDNSVKNKRNLPISNPKEDLHNIREYTKFGENSLTFTKLLSRNEHTDRWTYDRRMDRHTDNQRDTLTPRHYRVTGNKKSVINCMVKQSTKCFHIGPVSGPRAVVLTFG